jgi:phage I-like protein
MTQRSATPDLATGVAAGVVVIDVATAAAGNAHPEWIKVTPRGAATCRDGRSFTFDPEVLKARFTSEHTDVPMDLGHATVKDDAAPAHGWIKELQARSDGLYGRVDWLPSGIAILDAKTHRYISPAFKHDDAGHATWLHSVALVAAPALGSMPAIASADPSISEPSMKGIATALGLQPDANETACLSALSTLQATTVPKAVHDEALARLSAATADLQAIKDAAHKADVDRELEAALAAKKILPAQKAGLATLSATAEGFGQVKAILAATAANSVAGVSSLETRHAETGAATEKDAVTLSAEAKKLSAERGISFTDAMSIVSRPAIAAA